MTQDWNLAFIKNPIVLAEEEHDPFLPLTLQKVRISFGAVWEPEEKLQLDLGKDGARGDLGR